MAEPQRQLPPAALVALSKGNKIEAIKIVRTEWNFGLKEAKDQVDDYVRSHPALAGAVGSQAASGSRVMWLIVLIVLALGVYYYFRAH